MKPVKIFFINLAIMFGASMLLRLLSVTVFATIFNAIMGNPVSGGYVTNVFVRLGTMVFNVLAICIPHARNAEADGLPGDRRNARIAKMSVHDGVIEIERYPDHI